MDDRSGWAATIRCRIRWCERRDRQRLDVELDADNPGQWAAHCHNIYHAETGMMTMLSYKT